MADPNGQKHVLGREWHISGELSIDQDAVIEGQVDGIVRSRGQLDVGSGARISGTIIGDSIRLAGQVEGDVIGEQDVELLPGAKMRGRVYANKFCVNEGAGFRGEIWVDDDAMQEADQQVLRHLNGDNAAPAPRAAAAQQEDAGPELSENELAMLTNNRQRNGGNGSNGGNTPRFRTTNGGGR